jgi:hypothetical protein
VNKHSPAINTAESKEKPQPMLGIANEKGEIKEIPLGQDISLVDAFDWLNVKTLIGTYPNIVYVSEPIKDPILGAVQAKKFIDLPTMKWHDIKIAAQMIDEPLIPVLTRVDRVELPFDIVIDKTIYSDPKIPWEGGRPKILGRRNH